MPTQHLNFTPLNIEYIYCEECHMADETTHLKSATRRNLCGQKQLTSVQPTSEAKPPRCMHIQLEPATTCKQRAKGCNHPRAHNASRPLLHASRN